VIAFIFDTETSGLIDNRTLPDAKLPEIIEFYGCLADLSTGEVLSEVDLLIKPARAISDEITRITGLTNADLVDAPAFIAHNASYDVEMVNIEFDRIRSPIIWPRKVICTVEATLPLKGHRLSLQALHELLFGEQFPAAHRARNDVKALLRCCVELYKRAEI